MFAGLARILYLWDGSAIRRMARLSHDTSIVGTTRPDLWYFAMAPKCAAVVVGIGSNTASSPTKVVIDIMLESTTRVILFSSYASERWLAVGCLSCS